MGNNEVSIDLMHNFIGQFLGFQDTLKNSFVQFSTPQIKQNLEKAIYLFQDQNSLIDFKKSHFVSLND